MRFLFAVYFFFLAPETVKIKTNPQQGLIRSKEHTIIKKSVARACEKCKKNKGFAGKGRAKDGNESAPRGELFKACFMEQLDRIVRTISLSMGAAG